MHMAPEPPGGPSLWWMWGEMKEAFGRLEHGLLASHQRQDDMRREVLMHIKRLDQRLDKPLKTSSPGLSWLAHIPWDRVLAFLGTILGAIGWLKPQWVKMLTGG